MFSTSRASMASQAIGLNSKDFGNVIAGLINVRIAQHHERAAGRAPDQLHRSFERHRAGAFRADQRARDVEAVFGQQIRQVVAGDAARDVRETAGESRLRSGRRFVFKPA